MQREEGAGGRDQTVKGSGEPRDQGPGPRARSIHQDDQEICLHCPRLVSLIVSLNAYCQLPICHRNLAKKLRNSECQELQRSWSSV